LHVPTGALGRSTVGRDRDGAWRIGGVEGGGPGGFRKDGTRRSLVTTRFAD
jgi:hypothetical protein